MAKNIVILMDGTTNGIALQRTNILRLYGCLKKSEEQLVYYDPGVGTIGPDGIWSRTKQHTAELWGMATGFGVDQNVKEAYRFLIEHYDDGKAADTERDRIYIFGFSRGAYTARMLAGFIHEIGLIAPRNLNLLNYAYRAYKRIGANREAPFAEVQLYERILETERPPIRLLGLFDTVASVIEPGPGIVPQLKSHASTSNNASVEAVRHAVALAERRRMFGATLWPEDQPYRRNRFSNDESVRQDAREVWFTGSHGDVGGGHAEAESGLAKIPLQWMIEEAKATGLKFKTRTINRIVLGTDADAPKRYAPPDAFAAPHDSMTFGWRTLEYVPLPTKLRGMAGMSITRGKGRTIPHNARIHASVLARADAKGELPAHIPAKYRVEGNSAD
ncbi:DUF2235 domain-containing protein [Methyloligella sp. 2.7D]|uniref:DUF2235 domain-containing protein n=1 Tax=unclassified Methyloligella TaxID=2625955 RepID=UPI00157C3B41|nr:DUF2235 domain-containing protein [Methyloligella sp. GL2]QKP77644.1 DUF2235 domain-containing protein [Methyloligella sp. GL2]